MGANLLEHIGRAENGRVSGMTAYQLDEVLLTLLVDMRRRRASCNRENLLKVGTCAAAVMQS